MRSEGITALTSKTLAPGKQQVWALGTTTLRTMEDPITSTEGGAGSEVDPMGSAACTSAVGGPPAAAGSERSPA